MRVIFMIPKQPPPELKEPSKWYLHPLLTPYSPPKVPRIHQLPSKMLTKRPSVPAIHRRIITSNAHGNKTYVTASFYIERNFQRERVEKSHCRVHSCIRRGEEEEERRRGKRRFYWVAGISGVL
jgi:hypothetical protein